MLRKQKMGSLNSGGGAIKLPTLSKNDDE